MAVLSFEQFKELKTRGLSNDQIRKFSSGGVTEQPQKQDFLTSIRERVGFDPVKEILNVAMPASRGIPEQTIREYGEEPAASYINQALLNAPRSLMAKGGQTFPEENAVSRIAGFAGGVSPVGGTLKSLFAPASMAKTAAKSPQVMTAIRGLKGADMATKIKTVLGMAGKMGLTGAAYGAAYSPEDFTDVGARGRQALAGGIMGAGIGVPATLAAERLAVPAVKFMRKFGTRAKGKTQFPTQDFTKATTEKIERAKTGSVAQKDLLTKQMGDIKSRTVAEILPLEQESKLLKAQEESIGGVFGKKKQIYEKAKERVTEYVSRRTKELDSELTKVAESTALNSKQRIRDFNKNFNEKFGSTLDDISQGLSERGAELTAGELSETMSNIRNKMEQNGLKTGAKFDSLAKRISDLATDQPLDLKYITNEMKQVRPTQGKLTRAVTGVEDVGINDLQGWFMDWVESVAPEYKDLTSKSKTAIQVRNYLAQKAKPGDVFETSGMTKMVKDLASGKLSSADTQRINILEQGTGGFKGAGEFTGQVKQKGQQIADFKVKMEDAQRKLKDAAANAESLSDTMSILQTNKRNEISRKIQDIQDTIESKKKIEASDIASIQSELDTLTNELNAKIEKIKSGPLTGEKNIRRLKDSVSAINVIRKAVGVAAGTAIGTSAAMASLRSIGRALRYNIGNNE